MQSKTGEVHLGVTANAFVRGSGGKSQSECEKNFLFNSMFHVADLYNYFLILREYFIK